MKTASLSLGTATTMTPVYLELPDTNCPIADDMNEKLRLYAEACDEGQEREFVCCRSLLSKGKQERQKYISRSWCTETRRMLNGIGTGGEGAMERCKDCRGRSMEQQRPLTSPAEAKYPSRGGSEDRPPRTSADIE
ncbi:hypothetical protein OE88DRAFT_1725865 [Heliocybe sulcata]|uniref:Uncharacterized protein n=1 Tax=Heliocybe sulcata TaxID=5364 RepID=A0A5C3N3A5_9AGAM|nr:hypothetical protein OE88DRAFT_1725865 [Heliocybe sulcata]